MNTAGIIGHTGQLLKIKMMMGAGRFPQALLFTGMPGIGKNRIALRILQGIFCQEGGEACLECRECTAVEKGFHPDVIRLEPNEKGVIPVGKGDEPNTVRWLIERLSRKSFSGMYGVIVNGLENIPATGQNVLLKTIEEPPENAYIIMIATNRSLILPTILSRCTEITFYGLPEDDIASFFKGTDATGEMELVAALSGGSFEYAALLADPDVLKKSIKITHSICNYLETRGFLHIEADDVVKKTGQENFISILTNIFRLLLNASVSGEPIHPSFGNLKLPPSAEIRKVIKILISLRRGMIYNMNTSNTLKAMLYSIDTLSEFGFPGPGSIGEKADLLL